VRLGRVLLALGIGGVFASCFGGEISFESKPARTHLIELFTSEGCSSCPPAETWLGKLQSDPRLWIDFVPIAFHVTYWDNAAWRDPFASKEWTSRQYAYSALWKSSSVYTPAFVLDGREWLNREIPTIGGESSGVLRVVVANGEKAVVTFSPAAKDARTYEVHIAQLGFGLQSNVKGGENGGRKLVHDFVVLSIATARPGQATATLPLAKTDVGSRCGLAAWVTEVGGIEPIQATGGWLQ
jgi:hypothetical protein